VPATDRVLLVLLGARLVGFGPTDAIAGQAGLPLEDAREVLHHCRDQGWAAARDGRRPGWRLTPTGRAEGERRLAAELDERGARATVTAAYQRFLPHNQVLLTTCTAWQVRRGNELNDHRDEAYDARVIERLGALHEAATPVCTALAGVLERFGGYEARLQEALDRVRRGEHEWFTGAGVASYHSVWFQLHEDLLATLGIDRSGELRDRDG
jgi:hypothetical protein